MVVAAAAADVAAELPASEETPLVVVPPDPLVVGEPSLLDVVGEVDGEVVVVGVGDDEVGAEEEVVVGAAPLPDDAACRLSTIIPRHRRLL